MFLLASLPLLCACLSLVLAVPGCRFAPAQAPPAVPPAAPFSALAPAVAKPPVPVAAFIRALLDTAAAGSARAADAHRDLQSGPDLRAFFGPAGQAAWTLPADSANPDALAALALLARAAEFGLRPADYGLAALGALRDSLAHPAAAALAGQRAGPQARFEVGLSDALLRCMHDLRYGRLRPGAQPARGLTGGSSGAPDEPPAGVLRAALGAHRVPAALRGRQPAHREYRRLQQALARWLTQPGGSDSAAQHAARYQQVALNLERWRWDPIPAPEYILINIPAYELVVVAHDSVRQRHRVIVGKPETPTPTLSSSINHFTLAPDWHVPRSIATREILPRLKKDAGYLARNNLALYDDRGRILNPWRIAWARVTPQGFPYTIRQSAGCENALGNVVFRFPNPYSVYLHDTPTRQFFERPDRALSHGCIRLAEPPRLAAYLLRREGRPVQLPSDYECARQARPRNVRLARPMPLYVRYATCTVENGRFRCLPDIYRRDEPLRLALFGPRL